MAFQRQAVRASTPSYRRFTLVMDSSRGFASAPLYLRPCRLAFASAGAAERLNLAQQVQLVGSLYKRHAVTARRQLRPLVSVWFQVLFHSPSRRSFHLSLTVLVHYRSYPVFSLAGWCRLVQTGFLRSRLTQGISPPRFAYVYRPVTFCGAAFQSASSLLGLADVGPSTPGARRPPVWAAPRSLAATWGITELFSVPAGTEMFQFPALTSSKGYLLESRWVSPFGYLRIQAFVQLPAAFRSFTRPSSLAYAKASTIRP